MLRKILGIMGMIALVATMGVAITGCEKTDDTTPATTPDETTPTDDAGA